MPSCAKSTFYTPFLMPVNQFETTVMFSRSVQLSSLGLNLHLQVSLPAKSLRKVCVPWTSKNACKVFLQLFFSFMKKGDVACKEDVMLYIRISRHSWHSNHKHSLLKKRRWDGLGWSICIYSNMYATCKKALFAFISVITLNWAYFGCAAFLLDIVVINSQFAMCGQFNGLHAMEEKRLLY